MDLPQKAVSASEMKNHFGDCLGEVIDHRSPLLIEKHGKPMAVIVDAKLWARLRETSSTTPWASACEAITKEIAKKSRKQKKETSTLTLLKSLRGERS